LRIVDGTSAAALPDDADRWSGGASAARVPGVSTRMTLCAIFPYAAAIVAFALGS
jgi:hypothetical protein